MLNYIYFLYLGKTIFKYYSTYCISKHFNNTKATRFKLEFNTSTFKKKNIGVHAL